MVVAAAAVEEVVAKVLLQGGRAAERSDVAVEVAAAAEEEKARMVQDIQDVIRHWNLTSKQRSTSTALSDSPNAQVISTLEIHLCE